MQTNLIGQIRSALQQRGAHVVKLSGKSAPRGGVPDLQASYQGHSYALVVSTSPTASKSHQRRLQRMRDAGGVGAVVTSVEDAIEVVCGTDI